MVALVHAAVREAVEELAASFLTHPGSNTLREAVAGGRLEAAGLYGQLTRLLLRWSLMPARIPTSDTPLEWETWVLIFKQVRRPLNVQSEIFGDDACRDLETALCHPSAGARAFNLARQSDPAALYESLLSFFPQLVGDRLRLEAGPGRKGSGSYYSPPELVQLLMRGTVVHVLEERLREAHTAEQREQAVLGMRVLDPACGAGVFLTESARYLAGRLARIRAGDAAASDGLRASRDVARHCLYGVDSDALVADLCRWLLCREVGWDCYPAISSHVVAGDALIGACDRASDPNYRFRDVMAGGFHVVLTNPPWNVVQTQEVEFLQAQGRPELAALPGSKRKAALREFMAGDTDMGGEWAEAQQRTARLTRAAREGAMFPQSGFGKVNSSSLFTELAVSLTHQEGRAGLIVPSGLITDRFTSKLFRWLMSQRCVVSLYHFDNRQRLFPDIGTNLTFLLLTLSAPGQGRSQPDAAFFLHGPSDLDDRERHVPLSPLWPDLFNPETKTCPIFRTRRDAALTESVYRRWPVLGGADGPWRLRHRQGLFNMTSDSAYFIPEAEWRAAGGILTGTTVQFDGRRLLPLYEAKMMHHFDHRWATYTSTGWRPCPDKHKPSSLPQPRYWVDEDVVHARSTAWPALHRTMALRLVCRSTDERSVIGTILPHAVCGNSVLLVRAEGQDAAMYLALMAYLSSFALDYVARQKLGGANLNFHVLRQLPAPPPEAFAMPAPWEPDIALAQWMADRVVELCVTAYDLHHPQYPCSATLYGSLGEGGAGNAGEPFQRESTRAQGTMEEQRPVKGRTTAALAEGSDSLLLDHATTHDCRLNPVSCGRQEYHGGSGLQGDIYSKQCSGEETPNYMEDGPETEQPAHTGPGRPAIDSRTSEGREQVYPWDQERRARLRAELDAACFWLMGMSEEEAAYVLDTFPIVRRKEVSRYGRYRSRELIIDAYRSITVGEQEFRTSRVETDGSSLRR